MFERRCVLPLAIAVLLASGAAAQDTPHIPPRAYLPAILQIPDNTQPDVRLITLTDAQQQAQVANSALVRLGELQLEAARQHRLGVKSLYFPSVSTQADYLHPSESPGQIFSVQRPFTGGLLSVPVQ